MQEINKILIAYNVNFGCIKKEILDDITEILLLTNRKKHEKQKTIKRRNTKLETVYSNLHKKKNFWFDILFTKKNLDLISITTEYDKDLISKTIKILKDNLTHNLELKIVKGKWEIQKINKSKKNFASIEKELEFIKGGHKVDNNG